MFALLLAVLGREGSARAEAPPKRPVPDYDGRTPEATTLGERLLWAPRALFYPLYAVMEYGVRRPVGALVTLIERKQLLAFTQDKLENDDLKLGVFPTAFVDFGLRPSVGIDAWKKHFLSPRNDLSGHVATWGPSWLVVGLADRLRLTPTETLALRAEWVHRPDQVFFGLGPRSRQADRSRYGIDRVDVSPKLSAGLGPGSSIGVKAGVRAVWFNDERCCEDPNLRQRSASGAFPLPPGFERGGYTAAYHQLELTLDSRRPRPAPQTGVRLDVFGEQATDLRQPSGAHWVRYGGIAGAFVDLNGRARVLGLTVTALFADPIRGQIPFTEQVSLGGSAAMRGYLPGRLVDRSALVATLQYQWPVWVWADGVLHVAAGNVFGEHLSGLSPELMRLSAGTGLRTTGSPDSFSELLVGFGTETLQDGLQVTSFRLFFGGTRGF